jgi:class 3 adenylate cyclase
MARVSLKNIIGKNSELSAVILSLTQQPGPSLWIEDESGKLLLGEKNDDKNFSFPINLEDEVTGWVKGHEKGDTIARLLTYLLQKETEKKKLGSEVLNLYQEINLIFNFSEKLAQTIEPAAIAQLTLDQAVHSIQSTSGIVLLWDEETNQLLTPAKKGEPIFDENELTKHTQLLLKIGLSGQSEIMSDVSLLASAGIINPGIKSLLYAALKVNHRIMGAVILASHEAIQYSAGELKLLVTLALQSSSAIESALQYEKNIREVRAREEAILRIHEVTKKFVPNEFIRSLGHETLTDVKLGDQVEKIVTVLFTDIRNFTTLSEKMTPEENFRFVSSFNAQLGPIIRSHNGFINQYLGDSIMALFPENAVDALEAAIAMQKAVNDLSEKRQSMGMAPIKAGIGMHTGPLIMGITGDEFRLDAATISDTVNTAARIESLTKYYRAPLLLSGETLRHLREPELFHLRQLGKVQLKGKHNLLSIVECVDGYPDTELSKKVQTLSHFNTSMNAYFEQQFEDALQGFQAILHKDPADHTTIFFMENAFRYCNNGVPENWTGAEEMLSK